MTCPDCKSAGSIPIVITTLPCRTCGGSGRVADAGIVTIEENEQMSPESTKDKDCE